MTTFELQIRFPVRTANGTWLTAAYEVTGTDRPDQSMHGHARRLAQDLVSQNKNLYCYIGRKTGDVVEDIECWRWCSRTYGPINHWATHRSLGLPRIRANIIDR